MSLVLQSSGGGQITIQEPTTASNFTATLPAATGTVTLSDGSGNLSVSGNLSFNSGYGSAAVAYGCRAWVNFDGIGTPAIRASGNVSSITDNAVGNYTLNFTTAMPDTNYATILSHGYDGNGTDFVRDMVEISDGTNKTVSKTTMQILNSGAGALTDVSVAMVSIFR